MGFSFFVSAPLSGKVRFLLESVTEVTLRCLLFALLDYAMYENVHFSFRLSIFASVGNSEISLPGTLKNNWKTVYLQTWKINNGL